MKKKDAWWERPEGQEKPPEAEPQSVPEKKKTGWLADVLELIADAVSAFFD